MSIKQLNPYLNFEGNAAQAIERYQSVLGAKVEGVMRFGDVPGMKAPPGSEGRIIHARLQLGEGALMLSDVPPNMTVPHQSNTHVCLDFTDAAEEKTKFDALAKDGKVTMPLQDTFWGATFGMLTDAFGIQWMFNCNKPK